MYEDDRISVAVPGSWFVTSVYPSGADVPIVFRGDTAHREPIGAAFTSGKFRLFLLTHYGQASGIRGGRFGEVAEYTAPWVDRTEPWPCISFLQRNTTRLTEKLSRVDLYFDSARASAEALAECGHPSVKAVLWYGSYVTQACASGVSPECGGFFLNVSLLSGRGSHKLESPQSQMAFTLTFHAISPDKLPQKGDAQLENFLAEASELVRHITFK